MASRIRGFGRERYAGVKAGVTLGVVAAAGIAWAAFSQTHGASAGPAPKEETVQPASTEPATPTPLQRRATPAGAATGPTATPAAAERATPVPRPTRARTSRGS